MVTSLRFEEFSQLVYQKYSVSDSTFHHHHACCEIKKEYSKKKRKKYITLHKRFNINAYHKTNVEYQEQFHASHSEKSNVFM